jgi:hypothetical protein
MIKVLLILFFSASVIFAADEPKPAIQSAEQAVTRLREALDTGLKASLTEPDASR